MYYIVDCVDLGMIRSAGKAGCRGDSAHFQTDIEARSEEELRLLIKDAGYKLYSIIDSSTLPYTRDKDVRS